MVAVPPRPVWRTTGHFIAARRHARGIRHIVAALDGALLITGPGSAPDQRPDRAANQRAFAGIMGSGRADARADCTANNAIGDLTIVRRLHAALYDIIGVLLASHLIGVEGRWRLLRAGHDRNHRSGRCRGAGREQQQRRTGKNGYSSSLHGHTLPCSNNNAGCECQRHGRQRFRS